MVYIIGLFLIYACKYCCGNVNAIKKRGEKFSSGLFVFSSCTILFFISSFRGYDVGIDTQHYVDKFLLIRSYPFEKILSSFYTERVEFGYALLNKIVGCLFADPRAIIIVNSAIVCYGMANYIYRYSNEESVAVILFTCCGVFLYSFNITRQIMACVMMMNAWGALTHKKYWQSALWFFVGVSFHVTSVIFAVTYFFYFFRKNKKVVLITFGASLLLAMFYKPLLKFASQFITAFSYLDNTKDKVTARGIWLVWFVELLIAVFFMGSYFGGKKRKLLLKDCENAVDSEDLICVPIFVVYYILFTFLGTQFNYLDRFGNYFILFIIPLFINFGKVLNERIGKYSDLYWKGLQIVFIVYFVLSIRADQYQYVFGW